MAAAGNGAGSADTSAWGPYGEPAFVTKYGVMGSGKTVDDGKVFFADALYLAAPSGGLSALVANLKFEPKKQLVRTLDDAIGICQGLVALGPGGSAKNPFRAVVFDDATVLCKNTILAIEGDRSLVGTQAGKIDGRKVFLHLAKKIEILRYLLRELGMFGLMNFHDREPSVDQQGHFQRGGPNLGSVGQTGSVTPVIDMVVRVKLVPGRLPWAGVFEMRNADDAQFTYKDRYSVLPNIGPLNTAEALRAAGFLIPHPFPWMSDLVRAISEEVEAGAAAGAASGDAASRLKVYSRWLAHLLNQGTPEHLAMWVCQDGLDRAEIRMSRRSEMLARFGVSKGADGVFSTTR